MKSVCNPNYFSENATVRIIDSMIFNPLTNARIRTTFFELQINYTLFYFVQKWTKIKNIQ